MIETVKKIMGTNVIVQFLGLLIYPALAYKYSIEDMAVYGFLYASMTIFSSVITLKIDNLVFNLKRKDCYGVVIFYIRKIYLSFLLLVGFFYLMNIFLKVYGFEKIIIIAFSSTFLAGFNVLYNFMVRFGDERYNLIKMIRAFLELIAVSVIFFFELDIVNLFFLVSLTYFLSTSFLFFKFLRKNYDGGFQILMNNKNYIRLDIVSGFINNFYLYSPNYFLYFSSNNKILAGYYFLINRFFGVPVLMIAQSLSTTLKQYLSHKEGVSYHNQLNYFNKKIFNKINKIYILFLIISIFFVYFLDQFGYGGIFSVFMAMMPLFFLRFKFVVYAGLYYVLKLYSLQFKLQLWLLLVAILSCFTSLLFENGMFSIVVYSICTVMVYHFFLEKVLSLKG